MDNNPFVVPLLSGLVVWSEDESRPVQSHAFESQSHGVPYKHQFAWGPKLWLDFHYERNPSESRLAELERRIACGLCRDNYYRHKAALPPRLDDWHRWTWELHNLVNSEIGKPAFSWEDYEKRYLHWKKVEGTRIGFAAVNYESMGGTETFHHTLLPRLPGVIGFASLNNLRGDTDKLGVPAAQGIDAIVSMSIQSDVVISWNVDWTDKPRPKRLITVHHGSLSDIASTELCLQGDVVVCVNREVAEHVKTLTDKPVHCIEPAVDPSRLIPRQAVETNGKKICLWSHRFAKDKRPQLAIEIAKHLPDDWQMILTGHRGEVLQLYDRVTVLPPQHPGDWLAVADCFLSTSLFEGFGLSVAEAITAGVPVVSTPVGIATRPGLALTVPTDADTETWAVAILASQTMHLPSRELFGIEAFLSRWEEVIN